MENLRIENETRVSASPFEKEYRFVGAQPVKERISFFRLFRRRKFIRHDSNMKSAVKAIIWRIVGTMDTILISWLITGRLSFALSIGGVEVFTKMLLYYLHERIWVRIKF